jgi:hypothetical protein
MATTATVQLRLRIPLRTKARMKLARLFAHLGLLALTNRAVARLAFDVRVGRGRWRRRYVEASIDRKTKERTT